MSIKKINNIIFFLASSLSLANARIPAKYHDLSASEVPKHMLLKLSDGLKGDSWKNLSDHPAFKVLDIQAQHPQAKMNVFQKIMQGELNRGMGNALIQFYRKRNKHRLRGNNYVPLSSSLFQAPVFQNNQSLYSVQASMGFNLRSHVLHQIQWKNSELSSSSQTLFCLATYYEKLFTK